MSTQRGWEPKFPQPSMSPPPGGPGITTAGGGYLEASLVKVPILLTLLRQATEEGRELTEEEEYLAALMIEYSDNDATTALYESVGGATGAVPHL